MLDSIILSADWFAEGEVWNVGASGYASENSDPDPIETDPHCISDSTEDEVREELNLLAGLLLNKAKRVVIMVNGNEVRTLVSKKYLAFKTLAKNPLAFQSILFFI